MKATKAPAKKAPAQKASAKKAPAAKATTKKTNAKAATGSASTKATTTARAATANKKRKADDEEEDRPVKKARVVKALKPKVVINHAPTQKLNVYVFGEGSAGELGLGTAKNVIDVKRPRLNPLLSAKDVGVVQVDCGGMHVVALTHDNKILTWGVNDQGALGRDTTWSGGLKDAGQESDDDDDEDSGLNPFEATPTAISNDQFPEGTVFTSISAGDSSTFAVTDEGKVWGWGTFRVSITPDSISLYITKFHIEQYRSTRLYGESAHCANAYSSRQPQSHNQDYVRRQSHNCPRLQRPDLHLGERSTEPARLPDH